jgi:hypothetical protein
MGAAAASKIDLGTRGRMMASADAIIAAPSDAKGPLQFGMTPRGEVARLKRLWSDEFRDGARCAFLRQFDGDREAGGYPRGFHRWSLDRRNAWIAGFNVGFHDRPRLAREGAR